MDKELRASARATFLEGAEKLPGGCVVVTWSECLLLPDGTESWVGMCAIMEPSEPNPGDERRPTVSWKSDEFIPQDIINIVMEMEEYWWARQCDAAIFEALAQS